MAQTRPKLSWRSAPGGRRRPEAEASPVVAGARDRGSPIGAKREQHEHSLGGPAPDARWEAPREQAERVGRENWQCVRRALDAIGGDADNSDPAGDRTARDLAARIVAIGAAPARSIVGLDGPALRESIRAAREAAYVVPVPKSPLIPCAEPIPWPADVTIVPLVETRPHAIVRRGAPAMSADWDGTLRLMPEVP